MKPHNDDQMMRMQKDDETLLGPGEDGDQLRALRDDLCVAPAPDVRSAHLAAMDAALDLPEHAPARSELPPACRRRTRVIVLAAAATIGVLGITTGLAAAGTLPDPAQRQVARAAGAIGWEIPGSDEPARQVPVDPPKPEMSPFPSGSIPPSSAPLGSGRSVTPGGSDSGTGRRIAGTTGTATAAPTASPSPGKSGDAPGRVDAPPVPSAPAPSPSGTTPGQSGTTPGKSGSAPGHNTASDDADDRPGKSSSAPGQNKQADDAEAGPGNSANSANAANAPGHNKG